ncbi:uncharacterized protein LOC107778787 [Nicotiana tabacum]|uniref:Dolichol-phosphate mannosyltransferase subunit 3 n=1 Tax=Nicotiana tabacum TaxID=4097 RepID=A0A1S3YRA3_TOBAC
MSFWSMWNEFCGFLLFQMKQIVKILTIVFGVYALWIGLLQTSVVPESYTWLLPLYLIVSLGCYGLLMVGVGLMKFPTCPQEAVFLQQGVYISELSRQCVWSVIRSQRGAKIYPPKKAWAHIMDPTRPPFGFAVTGHRLRSQLQLFYQNILVDEDIVLGKQINKGV